MDIVLESKTEYIEKMYVKFYHNLWRHRSYEYKKEIHIYENVLY